MVPVITGLLILVAIALIATSGLPNTVKPKPIRQLTVENFATAPAPPPQKPVVATTPSVAPTTTPIKGPVPTTAVTSPSKAPESVPAKADVTPIVISKDVENLLIDKLKLLKVETPAKYNELFIKYKNSTNNDYRAQDYTNDLWDIFSKTRAKFMAKFPEVTAKTHAAVFVAAIKRQADVLINDTSLPTNREKGIALENVLRLNFPLFIQPVEKDTPAPPLAKAAPAPKLDSTPAPAPAPTPTVVAKPEQPTNAGMNNIEGNQFSLATFTLPVTTSINGNTISLTTAGKATQPVPANMVQSGPAPAISGGEMDRIITGLVKESLRTELEHLGKADKVAMTRKATPGLSQGNEFAAKMPADYKGAELNPNAASFDGGYNHLGPMGDYQDSYHPPLMPDGGYYDPRLYVRKDSVPCYGCSLDY
jgi:hypothetical protein